jgi:thiamine biosynthesis lipoprotein
MVLEAAAKSTRDAGDFRPHESPAETTRRIAGTARASFRDGAHELTFEALGTRCRISFAASESQAQGLQIAAFKWVGAFESKYSRFLPGSLISRINAAAGLHAVEIDAETEQLFSLCDQLHFMTRGVFDPTSLPLTRLWNWRRAQVPTDAEINAARALVGWRKVKRAPGSILLPEPGMALDLGGMGKEFAVDSVAQLLADGGARSVLVDFGADIRVIGAPADGRPAWHIGLDDPRNPGKPWCGLGVREGGVATSGDYVRGFEANGRRYGHILDIRTGRPAENGSLSASVMAPSCTQAGMISTAVFVLGPVAGRSLLEMPGVIGAVVTQTDIHASRHFYEHVVS